MLKFQISEIHDHYLSRLSIFLIHLGAFGEGSIDKVIEDLLKSRRDKDLARTTESTLIPTQPQSRASTSLPVKSSVDIAATTTTTASQVVTKVEMPSDEQNREDEDEEVEEAPLTIEETTYPIKTPPPG